MDNLEWASNCSSAEVDLVVPCCQVSIFLMPPTKSKSPQTALPFSEIEPQIFARILAVDYHIRFALVATINSQISFSTNLPNCPF